MFKKELLGKIKALKTDLENLKNKNYSSENFETSDYSKEMLSKTIEMLDMISNNNELKYWKEGKNQEIFVELANHLDNNSGLGVPVVFNEESLDIAKLFVKHLDGITLNDVTDSKAAKLGLSAVVDVNKLININLEALKANILMHETLVHSCEQNSKMKEMYDDFSSTSSSTSSMSPSQSALTRSSQKEKVTGGTLWDEIKNLDEKNVEEFKTRYSTYATSVMKEIENCDYNSFAVEEPDKFLKAQQPYSLENFAPKKFRFNPSEIMTNLLGLETQINEKLVKLGVEEVKTAYNHYDNDFDSETLKTQEQEFGSMCDKLTDELSKYQKSQKSLKKSVNPFGSSAKTREIKSQRANDIVKVINNSKKAFDDNTKQKDYRDIQDCSLRDRVFNISEAINNVLLENMKDSKQGGKSLGKISLILNRHAHKFIQLNAKLEHKTDCQILGRLKRYDEKLKPHREREMESKKGEDLRSSGRMGG